MEDSCPKRVAIIGAGTMGRQVAWACAANGLETFVYDTSPHQLTDARKQLFEWFAELPNETAQIAREHVQICTSLRQAVSEADLAFENVPEELALKRRVHAEIDKLLPEHALQGSNASALTCSAIASATGRMDRFFNMNFSFPRFQGYVELMPNPETSDSTMLSAAAWAKQIGMVPIATKKEIMGYTMNRIWRAIKKESLFLADRGYADPQDIDRLFMMFFNTSFGPFGLMDTVGLASILRVEERYFEATGDESDRPPAILRERVERNELGEMTGRGFYTWPDPAFRDPDWLRK